MDLFQVSEEIGPGLILWQPKGARMRHVIESFWKNEHYQNGYELIYSPHIGLSNLWEKSGHLHNYKENMFSPMPLDEQDYYLRPMNCPFHIMVYKSSNRSYRELPLRWAELGTVYRYEKSGVLHGLMRVRGFTQDDAHIICTPEQVEQEIAEVLRFSIHMWHAFGFTEIKAYLATKPAKAIGDDASWDTAIESLKKAIINQGLDFEIDEGGGAFYGPKIDLKVKDVIGREWQTTTIQFDFNLPERFKMDFVDSKNQRCRPFMIHRALLGSLERFFGILIEHYAGKFPLWLAPVQARILGVNEAQYGYCRELQAELQKAGLRCELDDRHESLGKKIREGRTDRLPYLLIVGEKEASAGSVLIRNRDTQEQNEYSLVEALQRLLTENSQRHLTLGL